MIQKLRSHFPEADKEYMITGAPQCIVPDANMGNMIASVQFDVIWVQYYNTPQCSARNWATANPKYLSTGIEQSSGFSYYLWANFLVGTASANAKLYIGLPGAPATTDLSTDYYLNITEMSGLVQAYYCQNNFGGVMIWEATSAENNTGSDGTYYQVVKKALLGYDTDPSLCCNSSIPPYGNSTVNSTRTCLPTTRTATVTASSTASTTSTTSSPPVVSTPTPTQPGITTDCNLFHLVVTGDVCESIATAADIPLTDFYIWNPSVGDTCANLWLNYYVCIGIL
jgi:chitinase